MLDAKTISKDCLAVYQAIRDIVDVICPAADVVEVKHAKWIDEHLECSICGRSISEICDADSSLSFGIEHEMKWCPFCGAKMVKGGVAYE